MTVDLDLPLALLCLVKIHPNMKNLTVVSLAAHTLEPFDIESCHPQHIALVQEKLGIASLAKFNMEFTRATTHGAQRKENRLKERK